MARGKWFNRIMAGGGISRCTLWKLVLVVALLAFIPAGATRASSIVVNTTADVVDANDNRCSLREAIIAANTGVASGPGPNECPGGSGVDTIVVPEGLYDLTLLGRGEDVAATGDLDIVRQGLQLTIQGAGPRATLIDGQGASDPSSSDRIFDVHAGVGSVTITGLRVQNGVPGEADGGGIRNSAPLSLGNVGVVGGQAVNGGAIANLGPSAQLQAQRVMVGVLGLENLVGPELLDLAGNLLGVLKGIDLGEFLILVDELGGAGANVGNGAARAGGGIYNAGGAQALLDTSMILGNTAGAAGGGIANELGGSTTLRSVIVAGNGAAGDGAVGGGVANMPRSTFGAALSYLAFNQSAGLGGGLYNASGDQTPTARPQNALMPQATLERMTIMSNSAINGGGIWNNGGLQVLNSTLHYNRAANAGGGLYQARSEMADAIFTHVTLSEHEAPAGAGIFSEQAVLPPEQGVGSQAMRSSVRLIATIINQQFVPAETCNGPVGSLGFNLDSMNKCGFTQPTDLVDTNPMLRGAIGWYGGETFSVALDYGSPAIDRVTQPLLPIDQRGVARPWPEGGASDIGAYEFVETYQFWAFKVGFTFPLCQGSRQRYALYLFNSGTMTVTNAVLSDTLPAMTTFIPSASSEGAVYDPQTRRVVFPLGTVAPYEWIIRELEVQVSPDIEPGTEITNVLQGVSDQYVSSPWTVTSIVAPRNQCGIPAADLSVVDWHDPLCAGWKQRYTITFTNTGTLPLAFVRISDTIPMPATFLPDESSPDAIVEADNSVMWYLPAVAPGEVVVRYLEIRLWTNHAPDSLVTNRTQVLTLQASSELVETTTRIERPENCGLTAAIVMQEVSDWHDPICAGWNQRYTLTFRNSGRVSLTNAHLVAALPQGLDPLLSQSSAGARYDATNRQVIWDIASVAPGQSITLYLEAHVSSGLSAGTLVRTCAWVTSDQGRSQQMCAETQVERCATPTPTPTFTPVPTPTSTPEPRRKTFLPILLHRIEW